MRRDPKVFVLGEDVGAYGGAFGVTQGLFDEFGEMRVVDTPISESAIIGISIGASLRGYRPVAEMQFADFISCGFDQIVNQAATLRYRYGGRASVPIVIRAPSGGNVGGGLYHSQNPEAWFIHRPGLKVVAPSTAYDAKGLLKAAIRDDNPVVYFEHKYLYRRAKGPVPEGDEIVPIGVAATRREGSDVTLITYGAMVTPSLEAADRLSKEGVEVEVIDLRTLMPFDKAAIFASLEKTSRVLVVHEDVKTLGLGAELSAVIMEEKFDQLDAPVLRVTYPDTHAPFSHVLEAYNLPEHRQDRRRAPETGRLLTCRSPGRHPRRHRADRAHRRARRAAVARALRSPLPAAVRADPPHRPRSQRGRGDAAGSVRPGLDARRNLQRVARSAGGVAGADRAQPRHRSAARQHGARCAPSRRRRCPIRCESPESSASVSEQQRAVARALEALPADQRVLIEQAYFLGSDAVRAGGDGSSCRSAPSKPEFAPACWRCASSCRRYSSSNDRGRQRGVRRDRGAGTRRRGRRPGAASGGEARG